MNQLTDSQFLLYIMIPNKANKQKSNPHSQHMGITISSKQYMALGDCTTNYTTKSMENQILSILIVILPLITSLLGDGGQ